MVEFVLVSVLVVVIALGLIQLALTLHVRNTALSSASEGARFAALADRSLADGEVRARSLLEASLGGVEAEVGAQVVDVGGRAAVAVEVTLPVPVIGLFGGPGITVRAHAFQEERS